MSLRHNGIVVDLSFLNATTLSADRIFVSLGVGGTWGNAYTALNGTGVAFPGGRVKSAGIGGLTLGGGHSWLTPKVGWVADNVLNYETVLALGELSACEARKSHSGIQPPVHFSRAALPLAQNFRKDG